MGRKCAEGYLGKAACTRSYPQPGIEQPKLPSCGPARGSPSAPASLPPCCRATGRQLRVVEAPACTGDGAADGRSCRDRGEGMWVHTGANELDYKPNGGTFDGFWCDPRTSADTADKVELATLKTKTLASSKLGGNGNSVSLVTDSFPVLTADAIRLYGATCACCALCLAQNMNTACDGKDNGQGGGTQPMRVRPPAAAGGLCGPSLMQCPQRGVCHQTFATDVLSAPRLCLPCLVQCKSWSLRALDPQGDYVCRLWATDDVENNGGQITLEPGKRVPDVYPDNWPEKLYYTSGNCECWWWGAGRAGLQSTAAGTAAWRHWSLSCAMHTRSLAPLGLGFAALSRLLAHMHLHATHLTPLLVCSAATKRWVLRGLLLPVQGRP